MFGRLFYTIASEIVMWNSMRRSRRNRKDR
jgi:hypothetical protein